MYTPKDTIKRVRKRNFIILLLDLILLVGIIFYITQYALVTKSLSLKDYDLKFRYTTLKDNIGYIFNLAIEAKKECELKIEGTGQVKFFIKDNNSILWRKWVSPQLKPLDLVENKKIFRKDFKLNKNEILNFSVIYDNYSEGFLKDGEYFFGVEVPVNNTNHLLSIPVIIKNGMIKKF